MNTDYEFLVEKEAMWAEMLMQVLTDNGILCTALPVYGAGMAMKTGTRERLRIFVPNADLARAKDLADAFFSTN